MNYVIVCLAFFGFTLAVFPVYVSNYVYFNSAEKYANLNVTVFGRVRLYNINTVKNSPDKIEMNGKSRQVDIRSLKRGAMRIFRRIYVSKLVQLSDYGLKNEANAYAAIAQYTGTGVLNLLFRANGKSAAIKNYVVLNNEHPYIVYYVKAVTVINLITVANIILIILWEKLNEFKNKKKQGE